MTDINTIKQRVRSVLSEKRFRHTLGVADEAERLAVRWGASPESAYLAGLIHDMAKEIPYDDALRMLESFGFKADDDLRRCPALLHGPLAACLAQREFGISDTDILSAVRYHTTGRAGMTVLEKIIYLADFIEPNRCFDGVDEVRQLAYENLDRAVLAESDMVIVFTVERGSFLHRGTVDTRNDLLASVGKE